MTDQSYPPADYTPLQQDLWAATKGIAVTQRAADTTGTTTERTVVLERGGKRGVGAAVQRVDAFIAALDALYVAEAAS